MAIYRAEQVQLSFAGESGVGGYLEAITTGASLTNAATLLTASVPGDRSVTISGAVTG